MNFMYLFSLVHQINFPMCTIASMPRLPEHCVEYVRVLLWPKEKPFGGSCPQYIKHINSTCILDGK